MQIPVGVLLDRFGPQRLLVAGAVFMTAAQLGFAFTGTYGGALVARVFVGMGDAMVFISVLRHHRLVVPGVPQPARSRRSPRCSASAVRWSRRSRCPGRWRRTAGRRRSWPAPRSASCSGCYVLVLVRDVPPGAPPSRSVKDVRTVGRDLRLAWRDPGTRLGLWSHFTTQFAANVMGLLWGFPFFVHAEHRTETEAGALLTLLVGVFIVGGPADRRLHHPAPLAALDGRARRSSRRWRPPGRSCCCGPVTRRCGCSCLLVVTTGLGGPGSMIGFDLARTFAPASRLGQASGIVNVGGFTASLLAVLGIGLVLDAVTPGSSTDYSAGGLHVRRCACSTSSGWSAACRSGGTATAPGRTSRTPSRETFRDMSGLEEYAPRPARVRGIARRGRR